MINYYHSAICICTICRLSYCLHGSRYSLIPTQFVVLRRPKSSAFRNGHSEKSVESFNYHVSNSVFLSFEGRQLKHKNPLEAQRHTSAAGVQKAPVRFSAESPRVSVPLMRMPAVAIRLCILPRSRHFLLVWSFKLLHHVISAGKR